jgi:hypothetical protein
VIQNESRSPAIIAPRCGISKCLTVVVRLLVIRPVGISVKESNAMTGSSTSATIVPVVIVEFAWREVGASVALVSYGYRLQSGTLAPFLPSPAS